MKSILRTRVAPLLFFLLPLVAYAENSTREAGYTIHHNAFPTATLTPEVAGNYQIVRSKYRGMINISVIRESAGTTGQAVTAKILAQAANLAGQTRKIELREIKEGTAIYYIGVFPIVDHETFRFSLEVTPEGHQKPIRASLTQQFFID